MEGTHKESQYKSRILVCQFVNIGMLYRSPHLEATFTYPFNIKTKAYLP